MSTFSRIVVIFVLGMLVVSCAVPTPVMTATDRPAATKLPEVSIVRHPKPANFKGMIKHSEPPKYDPESEDPFQVDLRSADLTQLDLSKSKDDLLFADFDSETAWPSADKMPADFDWQRIMETGKDPGLGLRVLHEQGITGKGVNIAIIDQPMIVEHIEYADQLRLYDEVDIMRNTESQMHGPAVASIAVGKTVGVAPEANLYYIATFAFDQSSFDPEDPKRDFRSMAEAVRRIVDLNRKLPGDQKIRVLSMSIGWSPEEAGYEEMTAAVDEAKETGIFVVSSSLSETYGWNFHGLGRDALSDPNTFESYQPGSWWQGRFYEEGLPADVILVPMDSRTTASPTGVEDYVFYRRGGWSWSIPYLAGMYALAVQVRPDVTPEEFWETALETGQTIQLQHAGNDYEFGVILDPQALIEALQSK